MGSRFNSLRKSNVRKETIVEKIVAERGEEPGLACILSAMEACQSYKPWHDKKTHETFLKPDTGKSPLARRPRARDGRRGRISRRCSFPDGAVRRPEPLPVAATVAIAAGETSAAGAGDRRLDTKMTSSRRHGACSGPPTMPLSSHASATIAGAPLGIATAHTSALMGLEARPIRVEVCCTRGPSFFQMVGLAEAAVREARVRVASALARLGVLLDEYALTVNLAPADLRKTGAGLDLALALAVLAAIGKLPSDALDGILLLGELSLDGALRPIRGVLPQLDGARARGFASAVVPFENAREAGLVDRLPVSTASALSEVIDHFTGSRQLPRTARTEFVACESDPSDGDLRDVCGQSMARRALEIAAAGGHNLLMIGPPGGGKTMLARLLPTLLPALTYDEAIETTKIHSVAGLVEPERGIVTRRPFRAPHHSISEQGLVGGGEVPRPGELSLAHNGVLFLDELAEFHRNTLEALRQPLEDGQVCIARARARAWYPARPMIVGAVNPCPCGFFGHPSRPCACSTKRRRAYQARLSGPLLDRLDLHVTLPPVEIGALTGTRSGESSAAVRDRVLAARQRQLARVERREVGARLNAALGGAELSQVSRLDHASRKLVENAAESLGLSARAFVKILRVARTIADLEESDRVRPTHVAEAIQGRILDRAWAR